MKHSRGNILGVDVSAINMDIAAEIISTWIENKDKNYVCVTPAHSIMDCYLNKDLMPIFNSSGMTTPDGMPITWILKIMGYKNVSRVAGSDLMEKIFNISERKGWKHFLYGSTPENLDALENQLIRKFPESTIVGKISPPFREPTENESAEYISEINKANPDIIWVGISSPKQEVWMSSHINKVQAPVLVGVGAAFDFLSGNKKRAPILLQKCGLEWLYRFCADPSKMWPRYRFYPLFVVLVVLQLIGLIQLRGKS